jgi:multidrug resistance efflux pump
MRRPSTASLHDRVTSLASARRDAEAEVARLTREERFLQTQLKEAEEQVRYYEGLLSVMRREWGKPRRLAEIVRRFG